MDTRDFKQVEKDLIQNFETKCQKDIEKINRLRIEKLKKLNNDMHSLKSILATIGVIFLVFNFIFSFFSGVIFIVVLFVIYFGKRKIAVNKIQNELALKLEDVTYNYISNTFTQIYRKNIVNHLSQARSIVGKIRPIMLNETLISTNFLSGKYKEVDFEIAEAIIRNNIEQDTGKVIVFNGTVCELHLNSEFGNNSVPKKLANKINEIIGAIGVSSEFDNYGNLIYALRYRTSGNNKIDIDNRIKAPIIHLKEVLIQLSYVCRLIDTVQDYEKEAIVPDEIKRQIARKISEIAFTKINSQPKAEPIKAEPTKEEPIKKPEIKTEEPKAIKEIQDDTIDLIDIVEF